MNTFGSSHIVWLHSSFFFFYPANDCISFLWAACLKTFSVHHLNYCFFNNLLRERTQQRQTQLTGCLTVILRMTSVLLTWRGFLVPEAASEHHARGLKGCREVLDRLWETRVPPCSCTISNVYNQEAYAHNISVNQVFTLWDYLRIKSTHLLFMTLSCRYSMGCLCVSTCSALWSLL